jgi:hypothetical protein
VSLRSEATRRPKNSHEGLNSVMHSIWYFVFFVNCAINRNVKDHSSLPVQKPLFYSVKQAEGGDEMVTRVTNENRD